MKLGMERERDGTCTEIYCSRKQTTKHSLQTVSLARDFFLRCLHDVTLTCDLKSLPASVKTFQYSAIHTITILYINNWFNGHSQS